LPKTHKNEKIYCGAGRVRSRQRRATCVRSSVDWWRRKSVP